MTQSLLLLTKYYTKHLSAHSAHARYATDPYLLKSTAKMEFRTAALIMPTGLPIHAILSLFPHWMPLKSSLLSLGRVPRLLAPLRRVH
jgi:hypothetical protein